MMVSFQRYEYSPAVTKTISAPASAFSISGSDSLAAAFPTWGLPPAPRPRVIPDPSVIFTWTPQFHTDDKRVTLKKKDMLGKRKT